MLIYCICYELTDKNNEQLARAAYSVNFIDHFLILSIFSLWGTFRFWAALIVAIVMCCIFFRFEGRLILDVQLYIRLWTKVRARTLRPENSSNGTPIELSSG